MTLETKTEEKTEEKTAEKAPSSPKRDPFWESYWRRREAQDAKENEPRAVFWRKARNAVRVITESSAETVSRLLRVYDGHYEDRTNRTAERELLIEPNRGSTTKIERYDFSLNEKLVLGTPSVVDMSLQPSVTIRPSRLITNAPLANFVLFLTIQTANVAITVGNMTDAYSYAANAVNSLLDCPTLSPANRAVLYGNYTGLVPVAPFEMGKEFIFIATWQGFATIVA